MGQSTFLNSTTVFIPTDIYLRRLFASDSPQTLIMATTGLADSAVSAYDATTPTKPSSLDPNVVGKLLVDLSSQIKDIQARGAFDLEATMAFQRAANYL